MSSAFPPPPPPPPPPPSARQVSTPPAPPHNVQPPAPRVPRAPLNRGAKLGIVGAVCAAAVVLAGVALWQRARNRPSGGVVREYVSSKLVDSNLRLTDLRSEITAAHKGAAQVTFVATVETIESLYTRIDAVPYLTRELGYDPGRTAEARRLLSSRLAPRLRALASLGGETPDATNAVILEPTVPAGSKLEYQGSLFARRIAGKWQMEMGNAQFVPAAPTGERRPPAPAKTYISSNESDRAALNALVEEEAACAKRILEARTKLEADLQKERAERVAMFKPGAVFAGVATNTGGAESHRLSIEMTELRAGTLQVTALLRNEGGWRDARRLQGRCQLNTEDESLTLLLTSAGAEAVRDAGPFLQDNDTLQFTFSVVGDELTARSRSGQWEYRLKLLPPDQARALKDDLDAEGAAMMAATKPGKLYRGVAVSKNRTQSHSYHLRIARQESDGAIITATLEPDTRDDIKRPFRGTLIGNRFRSEGWPLRLESRYEDRVTHEDGHLSSGHIRIYLKLEGESLIGESSDFTYKFEQATPEYLAEFQRTKLERETRLLTATKPGAVYDGYIRSSDGRISEKVRIQFRRLEQRGSLVEFTLVSLDAPGARAEMRGTLDLYTGQLSASRVRGTQSDRLRAPVLAWSSGSHPFRVTIGAASADGSVSSDEWTIAFNVHTASVPLPATVEPSTEGGQSVGESSNPANADANYPTAAGAYVWIAGKWQPLPRNGGKPTYGAAQVLTGVSNFLDALNGKQLDRHPDKLADLTFTGGEPVPTASATNVVIAYVGAIKPTPPDIIIKYPDMKDYPEIEMALTKRDANGARKAPIYRIVPGFAGFRETRVAGTCTRVSGNVTTFTCTGAVGAGAYAVSVNEQAYELNVQ